MKNIVFITLFIFTFSFHSLAQPQTPEKNSNPPIYIAFLWHMHQPIYFPYESIVQTQLNNRYPYSVFDIHNQRWGPYTSWPKNAVMKGVNANLPHFGAQVSFSGSLIENLNNLENYGNSNFTNWKSHWNSVKNLKTSLNNPRLDLVGFGYFHPLMGLIDYTDIRKQISMHKDIFSINFPGPYSKGIFPPENAFSNRMIPALKDEGIDWVLVDNVHFDRAALGYPFSTSGNLYEPNKSDIINPNPNDWVQLNGLWAPTKNSARWGRVPHYVEHINPTTGVKSKIIAVPCDRYMGNEDGRGGFGALNYDAVISQLESFNTDPSHPILIVLHHDGDNYGGGSDSYYGSNFQAFVNWLQVNPTRFVCTTVQDYLQVFPPDLNDVIHIEDGSWSGADNGDPEFKKWLGDPYNGYSPDRNSWGVLTAAQNYVHTAEQINPANSNTIQAWKYLLVGESSDYWYWDGSLNGIWDSHPTRAANLAIQTASLVTGNDLTPPTIFIPQREPYNPGGTEWGISQTNNLQVWSYVFDKSGLKSVKLRYRVDADGTNSPLSSDNETYAGGSEVGAWIDLDMTGTSLSSSTDPLPVLKAKEFTASITGLNNKLIDYYIESIDSNNNIARSPLKHCWIGENTGGGGTNTGVSWSPINPTKNDTITITLGSGQGAKLHWGVNNAGSTWNTPNSVYWPAGSVLFNNSGPAVESPFLGPDTANNLTLKIGPFNNTAQNVDKVAFVIHFNDNTWNNNNGQDFHITFGDSSSSQTFVMDGELDPSATLQISNQNQTLNLGWNGSELYIATNPASSAGGDVFIIISDSLRNPVAAPWAKSGQVAAWSLFLANESTNNWTGWFDNSGSPAKAVGSVLEGAFNVQSEFGYIPQYIYITVGVYGTNDAGALLQQVPSGNGDGNITGNEFYSFNFVISSLENNSITIENFNLWQNYPNPFNPSTIISFSLPESDFVTLRVYDIIGNEVSALINDQLSAGFHEVKFTPSALSSGIYFYKLQTQNHSSVRKMLLMK
ncbi:MAG: T9SS type A sorting domain-containing protein [Ignavibacteriaceae bacterium]